jgi:DNA replication factor GINS
MYNQLYKAWKSEKTSETPQPLPNDFYQSAAGYLKGLEEASSSRDTHTIQGRLLVKEKEMAKRLLDELRETRLQKIINAAKDGNVINPADLTEEEKTLIQGFNESLASYKEERREKTEQASAPEAGIELTVIRFLQEIPEIVGVDLKIYGPYKKEDVGSLPRQNAQALIKQGAAKPIEVRA